MTTNRVGAMWTWFFTKERVVDFATAATSDTGRASATFHRAMLDRRRLASAFAVRGDVSGHGTYDPRSSKRQCMRRNKPSLRYVRRSRRTEPAAQLL